MFVVHLQLGLIIHSLPELSVIFQSIGCFHFWNTMKFILAVLCFILRNIGRNAAEELSVSSE